MRIEQTIILLFALTVQLVRADDKISAPDFSNYSQTEAFRFFIGAQTNASLNLQHSNMLTMVSFMGGDRVGLMYSVNELGQEFDVRFVYDWAAQASHSKQLTNDQIKDLRSAIKELPAKSILPPIGQLVVVSFKENTNWVTRSYDQTNLPTAMQKIYDIIGERFESSKSKVEGGVIGTGAIQTNVPNGTLF
jgi:hypothetical protein